MYALYVTSVTVVFVSEVGFCVTIYPNVPAGGVTAERIVVAVVTTRGMLSFVVCHTS